MSDYSCIKHGHDFHEDCAACEAADDWAAMERRIAELEKQVAEHEYRWKWLNRSILALSKEGYTEWASGVLAVINKCRYEEVDDE